MTDKAKWASDVTNAIAGIAEAAAAPNFNNPHLREHNEQMLEQRKAVLEALLKDGV